MRWRPPADVGATLALFLATRASIVAVIAFVGALVPLNTGSCHGCRLTGIDALDDWARWDSHWYVEIAERGYTYDPNAQSSVAFFPLFPALMRLVALPFGTNDLSLTLAGMLISNAALIAALLVLVRFARTEGDGRFAGRIPAVYLAFPTTVFLSAAYPDSLMLLLGALAFASAREEHWWRAGLFAAFGTLTKPFGISVAGGLLLEAARQRADGRRALLPLALSPLVGLLWWFYLTELTGQPWAFFVTEARFRHHPGLFGTVGELFDPTKYGFPYLVAAMFGLTCVLVLLAWRRLSPSVAAQGTLMIAFMLGTGTLISSMRYELNVIPAFLLIAMALRPRWSSVAYLSASFALALLLAAMFSLQYWVG